MRQVIEAALADAEAGFMRYHGQAWFWPACAVLAVLALCWKAEQ